MIEGKETETEHVIIESVREDGRKFRPSDWIERLSAMLGEFGPDHRLHYARDVHPCAIEGQRCLLVDRHLEQSNPVAYAFILQFARDNELRVHPDRRQCQAPVAVERREASGTP